MIRRLPRSTRTATRFPYATLCRSPSRRGQDHRAAHADDAGGGKIGMVFQHFNLFPHMTALKNCMEAPVTVLKLPKAEAEERARDRSEEHTSELQSLMRSSYAVF